MSKYAAPDGHRRDGADEGKKYQRVAQAIEDDINSGALPPGTRLLAERFLKDEFGVSYMTVRHAVEQLRDDGLVYTRHGEGTFVIGPRPGTRPPGAPDAKGDADEDGDGDADADADADAPG